MDKLLVVLAVLLLLTSPAWAALSLDGSAGNFATSGSSAAVTLTTGSAGVVVVATVCNGFDTSSVSDTAGLVYAKRVELHQDTAPSNSTSLWTAPSFGGHASNVITVNYSGACTFATVHAFGIAGANTASFFDTNAGLPVTANTAPPTPSDPLSVSTDNANDFIVGVYRMSTTANPGAGAGWTQILGSSGGGFMLTEYQVVSATQSGLSVTIALGGVGDANSGIADAFTAAIGYILTEGADCINAENGDRLITEDATSGVGPCGTTAAAPPMRTLMGVGQ